MPGALHLTLRDGELRAANTGEPLDAAGTEALATLRASAKRGQDGVGRFGVGFAAVLAVSDAPAVVSTSGGVAWSAARTRDAVQAVPALADEVDRRGGAVPVLRLPEPLPARSHDDGLATEVRLPLRDDDATALVRRLLADVVEAGDGLLLVLDALAELVVAVDDREVRWSWDGDVAVRSDGLRRRWAAERRSGPLDARLLADRPVEERERARWSATAAVHVDGDGAVRPLPDGVPRALHAPTPTDEPLTLPVLVAATVPLDRDRRRTAPGPLRDAVLDAAAGTVAALAAALPPGAGVLDLVPVGLPDGEVDGRLRAALLEALAVTAFLPAADDPARRLRPREAVALELGAASGPATDALVGALDGLLPSDVALRRAPLAALDVRRLGAREVVDAVAPLERPPSWWGALYRALSGVGDVDALAGLPVPLADGGTTVGARGLLLPGDLPPDLDPAGLAALGLRAVHPDAAAPLLARLGAVEAGPRALLADPAVRRAVEDAWDVDDDEADALVAAVLALVAAARPEPGEHPELAELPLRDVSGEPAAAGELVVPGTAAADLLDLDAGPALVAADLVERWGPEVLAAVGCVTTLAVLVAEDVVADPEAGEGLALDGAEEWLADLAAAARAAGGRADAGPALLPSVEAVRDLELVRPDAWPRALRLLAEPPLRRLVVEPVRVVLPDGGSLAARSYTADWLRRHAPLPTPDGPRPPPEVRAPDADPALAGLLAPPPPWLDAELAAALGCARGADDLLADPGGLLDLLADPDRRVDRPLLRHLYAGLARRAPHLERLPRRVRAVHRGAVALVDAEGAVAVDAPDLLPLLGDRPVLPCPTAHGRALADVLDVELASDVVPAGVLSSPSSREPWAEVPGVAEACALLGHVVPEGEVAVHAALRCRGVDGGAVAVPWRAEGDVAHVDGEAGVVAVARALAWRLGRWERRDTLAALLAADAGERARLAAEEDLAD